MQVSVHRTKYRVFIVEDHPLVRFGITQLIDNEPDLIVCGESEGEANALTAIETAKPDVVVVDLTLKDGTGLSLIKKLSPLHPKLPVLVVSIEDELVSAQRALRAGAKGYLMKTGAIGDVLSAIRCLLAGQIYLSETMQARMLDKSARSNLSSGSFPDEKLSDRELEVFRLIGQGVTTKQVATQLHVSISTVATHRAEIKKKLGLESSADLLQHAVKWVAKDAGYGSAFNSVHDAGAGVQAGMFYI